MSEIFYPDIYPKANDRSRDDPGDLWDLMGPYGILQEEAAGCTSLHLPLTAIERLKAVNPLFYKGLRLFQLLCSEKLNDPRY